MIPGKIIIKNKVYFEPDGLEKPKEENYWKVDEFYSKIFQYQKYEIDALKYEASKQLIEVENVYKTQYGTWVYDTDIVKVFDGQEVINNQLCRAAIYATKNDKVTIIELL